jgi:hypothetical protein
MAKDKKVRTCDTPKYTSCSYEEFDDDVNYSNLFKGLDRSKVDKINELIDALNKKDRLLEKQEDSLYEEHDKAVEVEKSLALEIKKNEMLAFELSSCHSSITRLKSLNADFNARIEKLSVASSSMEHLSICTKCKDHDFDACSNHDFDACSNHASTIANLTNKIVQLNVQLTTCKNGVEKVKFARDAFTIGRHPSIKDGLGFQKRTKDTKSQKALNFTKEKVKAPMASSSHSFHEKKNHAYLYSDVKNVSHNAHHDICNDSFTFPKRHDGVFTSRTMFASSSGSSRSRTRCHASHVVSHAPKDRNASHGPSILFRIFDAFYGIYCKNDRFVATNVGPKCKKGKTCVWVPKYYVTNLTGPNTS